MENANVKERKMLNERYANKMETVLNNLIALCLTDLGRLQRQKIEAMITIHVHLMEIFRTVVANLIRLDDFNWQKQNRF